MPALDPNRPLPTIYWLMRFGHGTHGHAEPPRMFWTRAGLDRHLETMADDREKHLRFPVENPRPPSYDVWEIDLNAGTVRMINGEPGHRLT